MLSDLWSKFFLNKFLQKFPDIIMFVSITMCVSYWFHLIISIVKSYYIYRYMSWNIQFELTVLELVFRTSHLGRVGLWHRIGFI